MQNLITDLPALQTRLQNLAPAHTAMIADFDLTLAAKPEKNFHYVKLTDEQRAVLRETSERFAASIILTARGEASTLSGIFGGHSPFNICVASNCGHHVLVDASRHTNGQRISIPLADAEAETNLPTTLVSINRIIKTVGMGALTKLNDADLSRSAFEISEDLSSQPVDLPINGHAMLTLDPRERCGAVVFEGLTTGERGILQSLFLLAKQDHGTPHIYEAAKDVLINDGQQVNGYIDLKPTGMCKGTTSVRLLEMFRDRVQPSTHIIVAGDSKPDLEMMAAITKHHGAHNVTNIWVGNDPSASEFVKTSGLQIWNLPGAGNSAIPTMYAMLRNALQNPASRPKVA